jgi:hypothetical protein
MKKEVKKIIWYNTNEDTSLDYNVVENMSEMDCFDDCIWKDRNIQAITWLDNGVARGKFYTKLSKSYGLRSYTKEIIG